MLLTGPIGNPESYSIHNQVHRLVSATRLVWFKIHVYVFVLYCGCGGQTEVSNVIFIFRAFVITLHTENGLRKLNTCAFYLLNR